MSGSTTATVISLVAGLASTAVGTVGAIEASNAQKNQAEYQADMAEYNADIAEGNAQIAEEEGRRAKREADQAATRKRQETALLVGNQRARQGASGAQVDAGSNLDLNLDTIEKGELDALQIEEQGQLQELNKQHDAWNLRNQGAKDQSTANLYANKANQYSPLLSASPTVISGTKKASGDFINLF